MQSPWKELISLPVYLWGRSFIGERWEDVAAFCREEVLDGVELYIGYEDLSPSDVPAGLVQGVHLPFHSGWLEMMEEGQGKQRGRETVANTRRTGEVTICGSEGAVRFEPPFFAFSTHQDYVVALRLQLERAARLHAGYAVYHLGYYHTAEMFTRTYGRDDRDVLERAAVFLNELMADFPGNEPPVTLMFENLWYPGLTYTDPDACLAFMDQLEFSDYGFLLDTGHLMNCIATSDREEDCIATVCDCIETLPREVLNRIDVVHLHWSGSHSLRQERIRRGIPNGYNCMQRHDQGAFEYQHATLIDQHRPLSLPEARIMVEIACPSVIVHECIPKTLDDLTMFLALQRGALTRE
jgi:sugar phosphate isomerase/epimerase